MYQSSSTPPFSKIAMYPGHTFCIVLLHFPIYLTTVGRSLTTFINDK